MKTSDPDTYGRLQAAFDETFRLRMRWLAGRFARGSRNEHAELPPEAVLHRRRAVGIQHVPLEHDRIGDVLDEFERRGDHR
jgi:hypothetical protein